MDSGLLRSGLSRWSRYLKTTQTVSDYQSSVISMVIRSNIHTNLQYMHLAIAGNNGLCMPDIYELGGLRQHQSLTANLLVEISKVISEDIAEPSEFCCTLVGQTELESSCSCHCV